MQDPDLMCLRNFFCVILRAIGKYYRRAIIMVLIQEDYCACQGDMRVQEEYAMARGLSVRDCKQHWQQMITELRFWHEDGGK